MSSPRVQDPPQQRISGDERDFVTTAEPLRQPFSAVFDPAEPFRRGELLRHDSPLKRRVVETVSSGSQHVPAPFKRTQQQDL